MAYWRKPEEELPEEWQRVLVISDGHYEVGYWYNRGKIPRGKCWAIGGRSGGYGTPFWIRPPQYWTELPAPPEAYEQ